ncbi:MAG: OB-fold domain-containing protein [Burkholderiaceae bacterium]
MNDTTKNPSAGFENDPYALAYPETREFWAAAEQCSLMLKTCDDCHKPHWYPRVICPLCGSERTRWQRASGKGTLHAFSPARRGDPPYVLAYVTLDEGPMVMSNIVDAEPEALQIGQPVSVTWRAAKEGRMMPFFKPA